jgi:hypothetical protein
MPKIKDVIEVPPVKTATETPSKRITNDTNRRMTQIVLSFVLAQRTIIYYWETIFVDLSVGDVPPCRPIGGDRAAVTT